MNKKFFMAIAAIITAIVAIVPMLGKVSTTAIAEVDRTATLAKTGKAALLIDCDTGTVIFQKNVNERLPIASMIKIMTLGVAFEEMDKRGISPDTLVNASQNAADMGGSQAFLDANADYKLSELLKSIVVASANDSCVAVAEYLFGSADAFVAVMNERAAQWGMNNTMFVNCTGLPKDGQYSCAADVAIMFKKLLAYDRFFEYAKEWMYDFAHPSGRVTELTNTNKLIKYYDGCDGGKTGYTDEARSCITVTAKRGDTRLICVAIGAESSKTRNAEVSEMLNYGFANYKTIFAVRKGEKMGDYRIDNGKSEKISVIAADDCKAFVKSGEKGEVTIKPVITDVVAPVQAGQTVGKIIVSIDGAEYKQINAVAERSCGKKGYFDIWNDFVEEW